MAVTSNVVTPAAASIVTASPRRSRRSLAPAFAERQPVAHVDGGDDPGGPVAGDDRGREGRVAEDGSPDGDPGAPVPSAPGDGLRCAQAAADLDAALPMDLRNDRRDEAQLRRLPARAPSRSTTWSQAAPAPANERATASASSL